MDGTPKLRHQVCFALYSASRALTGLYRPALEPLGLTYPQYLVMLVLWERGGRSVKDLGAELRLDSGTLSPLLKRLEAANLVTRRRDPHDERSVVVAVTTEGERLAGRAGCVPATVAAASGMTVSELGDLRDTLMALTDKVTAATARAEARRDNQAEGASR